MPSSTQLEGNLKQHSCGCLRERSPATAPAALRYSPRSAAPRLCWPDQSLAARSSGCFDAMAARSRGYTKGWWKQTEGQLSLPRAAVPSSPLSGFPIPRTPKPFSQKRGRLSPEAASLRCRTSRQPIPENPLTGPSNPDCELCAGKGQ